MSLPGKFRPSYADVHGETASNPNLVDDGNTVRRVETLDRDAIGG